MCERESVGRDADRKCGKGCFGLKQENGKEFGKSVRDKGGEDVVSSFATINKRVG